MPVSPRTFCALAIIATLAALASNRSARAGAAEDEAIERKIAPVIECINSVDGPLMRAIEGYRKLLAEIKEKPNTGNLAFMGASSRAISIFRKRSNAPTLWREFRARDPRSMRSIAW
jgi:hypothetical protein